LLYDARCDIGTGLSGGMSILDKLCMRSLSFVAKCLHQSSALIRFIAYYGIIFAAGVSLMGMNVTFWSARYNFKTCDFTSGVVNMNRVIWQYCRRAMSESCERLCQFIVDLIRCWAWYGSDDECFLVRDEICEIITFLLHYRSSSSECL